MSYLPPVAAETFRLLRRPSTWVLLALPALAAAARIVIGRLAEVAERSRHLAETGRQLLDTGDSGFAPLAEGLRTGSIVLTLLLLIHGSLTLVRERESQGLAFSSLARGRAAVVLGKVWGLALYTLISFLLLFLACFAVAAWQYDLGDITLEGAVMAEASEIWAELFRGMFAALPALFAAGCFGLLVSSLSSSSGAAVAATLVPFFFYDLLKGFLEDAQQYVLFTYASFLGDESVLAELVGIARADSDAVWSEGLLARSCWVPGVEALLILCIAILVHRSRPA